MQQEFDAILISYMPDESSCGAPWLTGDPCDRDVLVYLATRLPQQHKGVAGGRQHACKLGERAEHLLLDTRGWDSSKRRGSPYMRDARRNAVETCERRQTHMARGFALPSPRATASSTG